MPDVVRADFGLPRSWQLLSSLRRSLLLPAALAIVAGFLLAGRYSPSALAVTINYYLGSGHWNTNVLSWQYFGKTEDPDGDSYVTPVSNAFAEWSTETDLLLSRVWDHDYDVRYTVDSYGNDGFYGYAFICSTNNYCNNQTAWNNPYADCLARSNTTYISGSTSWPQSRRRALAAHETGHCWSLAHSDNPDRIMYDTIRSVPSGPNSTDNTRVNSRY